MNPVSAVLFDFAGTLLVPEPRETWVSAACPDLPETEVAALARVLDEAGRPGGPEPVALPADLAEDYALRDVSTDRHRRLYEALMARVPGLGRDRVRRLYERGISPQGWVPYPDTGPVLLALQQRGIPVGVVSNVGFDLRAVFAGHGLDALVSTFVLSYELGFVKPAPAMFRAACAGLAMRPEDVLMVGDNPRADGGACDEGVRTLLLPYSAPGEIHGLDAVLRLV